MSEHYLGIDWGTHSSKWCYQSAGKLVVGPIWDSRVWREGNSLSAFPLERRHEGSQGEVGLKRKLIQDPDQPFWEGERPRLGVTLGEATTFSLLALLEDAYKTVRRRGIDLKTAEHVTVRLAHPNWIAPHNLPALKSYRDSAVVALSIFVSENPGEMAEKAYSIPVDTLRKTVLSHKACIDKLKPFPAEYSYKGYRDVLKGKTGDVTWEFIFESCAAGFPYLLEVE